MTDQKTITEETVIKEYPHSTRWLQGQVVIGVGNLVLTTERLVFLHQIEAGEKMAEKIQQLAEAPTSRVMDFALTLHRENFQIPVSSLVSAKVGWFSLLPFPRPCLRVTYKADKKGGNLKTESFMFTIPLLKGFFQLEITTVLGWTWMIRKVMRHKESII